jgi:serine/threonine protein kinase
MPKEGDVFARYTIEEFLGAGGKGEVYRAYDPRLDRRVALKVLVFPADDARSEGSPVCSARRAPQRRSTSPTR